MIVRTATAAVAALLAIPVAPAAGDTYADFAELAANETEGVDFRRSARAGATDVAHIAVHGGGIEPPTSELAERAARSGGHAFAAFEGIKPSGNSVLHITSTRFDEPRTLDVVGGSTRTVSWHGAAGDRPATYVGGRDADLRDAVREELRAGGFHAPDTVPDGLEGESPANITNRNARGEGVQLEITSAQREAFTRGGVPTDAFGAYVAAVERAVHRR
ncbi:poly-gamma-glutamate hydrolase family protein [Saccharopolyspora sp. HNM0983]|uniref:Poly-gamma-glutamate hydrolase family protein n=1 Tax=Saccharopolyspora montiporae TaxID=2781240 RepID=A0A929BFB9_9PSEU|nr:poly-gamma-glutamate hydrolase family protein [Saccharopolyspora sp. HNM0983]MBE9376422.1 poly-gamma-glutamate hydrolase family protein [Saccharopolyspora sp. HNM0983]